ncbi:MAG: hypothetical protein A07HR60_01484 [uncultured archaeon A07HR60]|nr:MAG: hypothetical protein A07HR60_01484 [uncultured archaeon A07HR60]
MAPSGEAGLSFASRGESLSGICVRLLSEQLCVLRVKATTEPTPRQLATGANANVSSTPSALVTQTTRDGGIPRTLATRYIWPVSRNEAATEDRRHLCSQEGIGECTCQ